MNRNMHEENINLQYLRDVTQKRSFGGRRYLLDFLGEDLPAKKHFPIDYCIRMIECHRYNLQ